jgi:hypothetical protein
VLATLDPVTRRIEHLNVELALLASDCFFAVRIHRSDRQAVVMLCDDTDGLQVLGDGSTALALSRARLNSPAIDTARMIWSRRRFQVHPAFALQVQLRLLSSTTPLRLADLLKSSEFSNIESVDSLMAMACKGQVDIHIKGSLHPDTLVTAPPLHLNDDAQEPAKPIAERVT